MGKQWCVVPCILFFHGNCATHTHGQLRTDVLSCLDVSVYGWMYYKWLTSTPTPSHTHPKIQGLICACVLPPVQNVCLVRLNYVKLYTETVVLMCQWFPFHWHGRTTKRSSTHNFRSSSKIDKVSCEALPNIPNLAALLQSRAFCRHGILINVGTPVMHIYLVSSGTFSVRGRIKVKPPKDQPLQLPWQLILSKIGGWSGFLCVANLQSENLKH